MENLQNKCIVGLGMNLTDGLITKTMSNKQSSVEWLQAIELERDLNLADWNKAKSMQQEQAQLYATFVLKCVNNNLPPITFNDWINLENNEQQ
jgi:hypothetical protein